MKRRDFIKGLIAAGSSATVAHKASASRAGPWAMDNPATELDYRLLQTSPLAGFQFYEGEDIWPRLKIGHQLTLIREPNNHHDERAIEVFWEEPSSYGCIRMLHKLGYLPQRDNCAIQQLMGRREDLIARISLLKYSDDVWERVGMDIFMFDKMINPSDLQKTRR